MVNSWSIWEGEVIGDVVWVSCFIDSLSSELSSSDIWSREVKLYISIVERDI